MPEFLGLPGTGKFLDSGPEDAFIGNLQAFLLELGKGFALVERQQRESTESMLFYLDLVFNNYLLEYFILFELKTGDLTHQDIGQIMQLLLKNDMQAYRKSVETESFRRQVSVMECALARVRAFGLGGSGDRSPQCKYRSFSVVSGEAAFPAGNKWG